MRNLIYFTIFHIYEKFDIFHYFSLKLIFFRGGPDSTCAYGYVGPLCQTCDIDGETKFIKSSDDICIQCEDPSKSIPQIIFKILAILAFYALIIW